MKVEAGLIGGSGVGGLLMQEPGQIVHVPTPYGTIRGKVISLSGRSVFLLSRHSAGHSVPPHRVNYRGMALALKQLGARYCLATAAVGSLKSSLVVGEMMVCSDFLDLTYRNLTLFDDTVVHTALAAPFGPVARTALLAAAGKDVRDKGVYVGLNGPRYETPHEIVSLGHVGDVVGMTASSEAILMREAGIEYAVLAAVTNMGEGLGGIVDHGIVGEAMESMGPRAVEILKRAVAELI